MTTVANIDVQGAFDAEPQVKFSIRNLWKIFGARLPQLVERYNTPPAAQICKDLGLFTAVSDVNLDIRAGEVFVIMGLSGSGKSTLLRCICQLIRPTYGSVLLNGVDISRASEQQLIELRRHQMGMVFQNYALLPHRSVLENIALPLEIQGVGRAQRMKRAAELVQLVGLRGKENAFPRELSGGQQQRVGIARSLAVDPEIWLLDEPFSALDPLIRRELQNEILRLQRVVKKTVIFITHDFDEAVRLASRIAIMRDGAIVQVGTAQDLILRPADDYVAEFTRHVDRARVLNADGIMLPAAAGDDGTRVPRSTKVSELATILTGDAHQVLIEDDAGEVVGKVTKDRLLQLMSNATASQS